ncbi:hypothetical protein GCM10008931_43930 [Oceanobacillus oncorhynchi subsp. oncorhynchi]|uniref:hypothetical protein n=1 Tax=Oceanobacillus oncorhynchi TaxID=545501 RepID=UPI0031D9783D
MKITEDRINRLNKVNELLSFIVKTDGDSRNPFFGHKEDNGQLIAGFFLFNYRNQLRYIDPYTKEPISLHPRSKQIHRKCNEGGTGQAIIKQLGRFIMFGKQGYLNDYKEVWGWEFEPTMKVRKKAKEIGFINSIDYPHKRWGD